VTIRAQRKQLVDAGIAVVAFGLTLAMLASHAFGEERALDTLGGLLAALASLPLVARRAAPLPVLVVTTAATAALYELDYNLGPPVGLAIALYTVADTRDETNSRARRAVLLGIAAVLVSVHVAQGGPSIELLFGALVWAAAWFAGDRARLRRERIAELEQRAQRAEREAERERRLAAAEERTRIARDLHDSAGHAINVILVQAGAARLLGEQDPERSRAALQTIEEVARETLGEIDQLVRTLRDDRALDETRDDVEPPPGLAALEALVERHRSAGLDVSVRARGPRRPLPAGLDRAAYRILQEALTNAARHGDGTAEVEIAFGPGALELALSNPTRPGKAANGAGHGIVGMRERAVLLGGTLEAAASNGVYRVRARLPYGGSEA
jgi:signal transduction histidine kinase